MLKRYTLPVMADLWGDEVRKYLYWLEVELCVLQARSILGTLPQEAYFAIREAARVDERRIAELEAEYDHDLIAFVTQIQESLVAGGAGQWKEQFHLGLTSYDVEDPALQLMLRRATEEINTALLRLENVLRDRAYEHQWTLMIARTHGQYAEPTTFGALLLVFADAVARAHRRLKYTLEGSLGEGRLSGAVGNFATVTPELARQALGLMRLTLAKAETQILQRDRHAELICNLAIAAASMEQIARTFWQMMHSEVRELEEPRKPKQRGSSAMAHKHHNPILTERLIGMARLLRGHAQAALENVATLECRDISQSSVERHIFPDATSITYYMAVKLTGLVERLVVFPDRMRENLDRTCGVWASHRVRNALMEAGVSYETAYLYLQRCSFKAAEEEVSLFGVLHGVPISDEPDAKTARDILGSECLTACFDPMTYIREGIEFMFERTQTLFPNDTASS